MKILSGREACRLLLIVCAVANALTFSVSQSRAQTYRVLHVFKGTEGANPFSGVIQDSRGNLYGTTNPQWLAGFGTVYELSPKGHLTVLHNFDGYDGWGPQAELTFDAHGNVYGTTPLGGTGNCFGGCGVVFEITNHGHGQFIALYKFLNESDGFGPNGGVVLDGQGNLFGPAGGGGANKLGSVYELSKTGTFSTLYSFSGPEGELPLGRLIRDSAGSFLGTTASGGHSPSGSGVIFRLDQPVKETTLHSFQGKSDGGQPAGGVARDADGNVYVTLSLGGDLNCFAPIGCGSVYEISAQGKRKTLHRFKAGSDGWSPWGTPVLDRAGNLYGTTSGGGGGPCQYGCGTVFKLDRKGKLTILHAFQGGTDGALPGPQALWLDGKGHIYGTTTVGGDVNCDPTGLGCGVVFELTP